MINAGGARSCSPFSSTPSVLLLLLLVLLTHRQRVSVTPAFTDARHRRPGGLRPRRVRHEDLRAHCRAHAGSRRRRGAGYPPAVLAVPLLHDERRELVAQDQLQLLGQALLAPILVVDVRADDALGAGVEAPRLLDVDLRRDRSIEGQGSRA